MDYRASVLAVLLLPCIPVPALSQTIEVSVGGKQRPWDTKQNSSLPYGIDDGDLPRYVFDSKIIPGSVVIISASGNVFVPINGSQDSDLDLSKNREDTHTSNPSIKPFRGADQLSQSEMSELDDFRPKQGHASGSGMSADMFSPPIAQPNKQGLDPNAPHAVSGSWGPDGQKLQTANGRNSSMGVRFPSYYINQRYYPVYVNELIGSFVNSEGKLVSYPFVVGRGVTAKVPDNASGIALGLNSDVFSNNYGFFFVRIRVNSPSVTIVPN